MAEIKKTVKKIVKKKSSKQLDISTAVNMIAATEAGQIYFRYLCGICGVFETSVEFRNGTLDKEAASYNDGRKSVYLSNVRPFLKGKEVLNRIERGGK